MKLAFPARLEYPYRRRGQGGGMSHKIGDFLVGIGAMDELQVEEVLRVQREDEEPKMFGEIAIELGYIDDSILRTYIDQKAEGGAA
jgi:hypothetical protein